ncbi:MAG TPA: GPW/gp25 family protein, partial [Pyrinomonadaceae bacterium]|nr:GPW/gp25 family protein [Pyrinomonadaceae bacterium]
FGCGIHELVFESNSATTIAVITQSVREALVAYEPRIDVLDINTENDPAELNLLLIRIDYRVRSNNARGNLVYPFYIRERD